MSTGEPVGLHQLAAGVRKDVAKLMKPRKKHWESGHMTSWAGGHMCVLHLYAVGACAAPVMMPQYEGAISTTAVTPEHHVHEVSCGIWHSPLMCRRVVASDALGLEEYSEVHE